MQSTGMTENGRGAGPAGTTAGTGRSWAGRVLTGVVAGSAALVLLSGCSALPGSHGSLTVPGTAGPAGVTPPTDSDPATPSGTKTSPTTPGASKPSSSKSGATPASSAEGCPAGGLKIPSGAGRARTPDLDGDGKSDTVWIADRGGDRTLGVRTASGAGFSRTFTNGGPVNATARAGRLSDGTAIILLDFSREVQLYAVVGCKIVVTVNTQGSQYTFDEGFGGYGTGVGCPKIDGARTLAGYLATATGSTYKVTRTTINLSAGGAKATNGTTTTLGTGLAADSSTVRTAQDVSCGSSPAAVEPIS